MPSPDSCLQPDTRNLFGTSGNVFENPSAPDEPTASCLGMCTQEVSQLHIANFWPWTQEDLLRTLMNERETLNTWQYRHRDLQGSLQLGIPLLKQKKVVAMHWIKEVEMVDSVDDLKSSQSMGGHRFPNFEMLDAKNASSLTMIVQNSYSKNRVNVAEQKAQLEDRFLRGRQIAFLLFEYVRETIAHEAVLAFADLFRIALQGDDAQDCDTR